jgi:hypothetical protein
MDGELSIDKKLFIEVSLSYSSSETCAPAIGWPVALFVTTPVNRMVGWSRVQESSSASRKQKPRADADRPSQFT